MSNNESNKCIFCNSKKILYKKAFYAPFLVERMFDNQDIKTDLHICKHCKTGYSSYRPNDEEMSKLYKNYRDGNYQKQRQKFEPEYTHEENNKHGNNYNTKIIRKNRIDNILNNVNLKKINSVLDYGGDRGQFIPDSLSKKNRYVYEISDVKPIDNIVTINSHKILLKQKFDLVLCCHVLEHVSEPRKIIKELIKLTNRGGYIYIEVPRSHYSYYKTKELFRIHEHINYYTIKSFLMLEKIYRNIHKIDLIYDKDYIGVLFKKSFWSI